MDVEDEEERRGGRFQ